MPSTVELQSSTYMNSCLGRAEFQVRMQRGWTGLRSYHVVSLDSGLLMLSLGTGYKPSQFGGTLSNAGGLLGGKFGRFLGAAIEKAGEVPLSQADNNFSMCSDQELIDKARTERKHRGSLVVAYDEVVSASIEKPGATGVLTRGGVVAGVVSIHEKTLGKMTWEICDVQSMCAAVEFLPARFGEKVKVNVEFDRAKMVFVKRSI